MTFGAVNIRRLGLTEFLAESGEKAVFDVRTPGEFGAGSLPFALNLPLFSDEERAVVGTIYKQVGKKKAIKTGLDFVGPKMSSFIESVETLSGRKEILLYCFRGGMRSGAMAWLLSFYGFEVGILDGGYKSFRRWAVESFDKCPPIKILGGPTGSQKTQILHEIARLGGQMIDLEALARHKGSAFGALGETEQPSQERFENELAQIWRSLDFSRTLWLEDESNTIGKLAIPYPIWVKMRVAPVVVFLETPFETRVQTLVSQYGKFPADALKESILKIEKRLGGDIKIALEALENGALDVVCRIALRYYDRTYQKGVAKREAETVFHFHPTRESPKEIAQEILNRFETNDKTIT